MRKNLHYKVLASVLAIAGLYFYNAPAAWAEIEKVKEAPYIWIGNGTITNNNNDQIQTTDSVYGWCSHWSNYGDSSKEGNNNEITIKNSTLSNVTGAYVESGKINATHNTVNIENSSITSSLVGGYSIDGIVSDNKVFITNTDESKTYNFNIVSGGTTSYGTATSNKVTINGNVTASGFIAGGVAEAGYSQVYGNQVIIQSGTVTGRIYGGFAYSNTDETTDVYNNNITIKNTVAKNIDADLYGGYADNTQAAIRDNTLTLDGWSGSVNSVNNFSDIYINNFTLNTNLINVGSVSGMDGVKIHLGAFTATKDDFKINAGDYAVGDNVKAATIEWDKKLGSKVDFTIKDEDGNDVHAFDESLANYQIEDKFYTADRKDGGGVYATKFDNEDGYSTSHKDDTNFVSITAKVEKSVLAGKFIDEKGNTQCNSNQTADTASLTIGEGFRTEVGTVAGVYAASGNNATGGKLIISGNTDYDKDLYGAYAEENGNAENSTVEISGNTNYSGTVYAGYSEKGAVKDNTINVSENIKAKNMSLSGSNTTGSGNELNITGNGSAFKKIENFNTINFNDVALNTADAALTVNNADVEGTTINVNSLEGGNNYHGGESVTLLKSANAITGAGNVTINTDIVTAGLTQDLHISTAAQSADNTSIDLYVKDVSLNDQITLVAENRAVAAAFVNQGTDLISNILDTLSRYGNYGGCEQRP